MLGDGIIVETLHRAEIKQAERKSFRAMWNFHDVRNFHVNVARAARAHAPRPAGGMRDGLRPLQPVLDKRHCAVRLVGFHAMRIPTLMSRAPRAPRAPRGRPREATSGSDGGR